MKRRIREELFDHGLYINQVSDLLLWHFNSLDDAADYFGVRAIVISGVQEGKNAV